MEPRFETVDLPCPVLGPGGVRAEAGPSAMLEDARAEGGNGHLAAISAERIHGVLRRMSAADWARLKDLLREQLAHASRESDLEVLERMFRTGELAGGQAGGVVLRMVQAMLGNPALLAHLKEANERMRERVRFILQEMSDEQWRAFRTSLEQRLSQPTRTDDWEVLELVFRVGESVSNIETAAQALAARLSGRKLLQPDVARRNALVVVARPGVVKADPEAAYLAAQRAIAQAEGTAARAECTLAYRYVRPTMPYKHARNTVFRVVDAVLGNAELMAEAGRIEEMLRAVKPVSREQMRWALHRMPVRQRIEVIRLIPLNTILMFAPGEGRAKGPDVALRATRNRRLAYDFFVRGQSDEELMAAYELSANGVKNEVGVILEALVRKPLARQRVNEYLARVEGIEPMDLEEARRRMKRLPSGRRAELVQAIPGSAWRSKETMLIHKHLFLDYLSGEWVLGPLVDYYNLEKGERISGHFKFEGTLTVRGAHAAIDGLLRKLIAEPELRQRLRQWTGLDFRAGLFVVEAAAEAEETGVEELMPPEPTGILRPAPPVPPLNRMCARASHSPALDSRHAVAG